MASQKKKAFNKLGFLAFSAFQKSFAKKGVVEAEKAGAKLGSMLYRLDKKHRERAHSNLALAYPDMPEAERVALAQRCFQHFGRTFADFLRSPSRSNKEVLETLDLVGMENIEEALAGGKGVILIAGHFGNFERAAHAIAAMNHKVSVVARDANDGDLNQAVMKIRETQGVQVLSRGQAARGILTRLKNNEFIGVLTDQNSGDMFVPFFGKPCGTVTGICSIHLKTGAPMIPLYCTWLSPGKYELRAYPPLQPLEGYEPLEGITRAMSNMLETVVRKSPEQWLWFHDRWKSARRAGLL